MFFRKTGVKIAGAVLCILSLTAGLISGYFVMTLLSAGSYDQGTTPFASYAANKLRQDADDIMYNYFDPQEPTEPWRSYCDGGIYTGEDSNFIYTITDDETGYAVLSTVEGGEPVMQKWINTYHFETETSVAVNADATNVEDPVFTFDGTLYAYSQEDKAFLPVGAMETEYIHADTQLDDNALNNGVVYQGEYYTYDGYGFYESGYEEYVRTSHSYTITCYLLSGLPNQDVYRSVYGLSQSLYAMRYGLLAVMAAGLALGLILLILLGCTVGRKPGEDAAVLPRVFHLPSDLVAALGALGVCLCASLLLEVIQSPYLTVVLVCDALVVLAAVAIVVYCVLQICARAKTRTLVSGSFILWCGRNAVRFVRWAIRWCRRGLGYLPLVWKVLVCYLGLCLLELIAIGVSDFGISGGYFVFWILEKLALGALVAYVTLVFRRLKSGAESIAAGDYNTKVEDEYLVLDFKDTADTLNHIQDGMNAAVESRMRSERLKTELITNVSHDLKTPLTSIVSYIDLLKQEPVGSEAAGEYLEVLDRQSQRLKKLIEDLVEASKASTGNITVHPAPLDFGMLLGQALGEYTQRLEAAGLSPVLRVPEETVMVRADGRLLWRVFDNLLGNILKYAMPGTRVYLTVAAGQTVTATFRNISRDELDVTADELMERFVRGDASRHTEGSGLGLSIAKSLTESMGGQFSLSLDGDLFKAMVTFPVLSAPPETETE